MSNVNQVTEQENTRCTSKWVKAGAEYFHCTAACPQTEMPPQKTYKNRYLKSNIWQPPRHHLHFAIPVKTPLPPCLHPWHPGLLGSLWLLPTPRRALPGGHTPTAVPAHPAARWCSTSTSRAERLLPQPRGRPGLPAPARGRASGTGRAPGAPPHPSPGSPPQGLGTGTGTGSGSGPAAGLSCPSPALTAASPAAAAAATRKSRPRCRRRRRREWRAARPMRRAGPAPGGRREGRESPFPWAGAPSGLRAPGGIPALPPVLECRGSWGRPAPPAGAAGL